MTGHCYQKHSPITAPLVFLSRLLYCSLAVSCFLIGASTTHGLGGHLRFGEPEDEEQKEGLELSAATESLSSRTGSLNEDTDFASSIPDGSPRKSEEENCKPAASSAGRLTVAQADDPLLQGSDSKTGCLELEDGSSARWQFFQPFSGGTAFVATQVGRKTCQSR